MNKASRLSAKKVGFFLRLAVGLFVNGIHADPVLTGPTLQPNGSVAVTISGSAAAPVVLQGSADMKSWTDLQTYELTGPEITYQAPAAEKHHQWFRLKTGSDTTPPPNSLPDLGDQVNAVFVAGEGFDTVQFAPDGRLGFIFWKGADLMIRERTSSGHSTEQVVTSGGNVFQVNITRHDYRFQPPALLLYGSDSQPHVFVARGGKTISHFVLSGSTWTTGEQIEAASANAAVDRLVGAVGPGNVFHLAVVSGGTSPNLSYGSNQNGNWNWSNVSVAGGAFPQFYLPPSYAPRWLSMAVDSNNAAHIVFRPEFKVHYNGIYPRAYNELAYASNRSGQWRVAIVQKPLDLSGEAGNGASIAIGPDNKPYIASWYNERGDGGSSQHSRLFFQSQDANGNWTKAQVISRPDSYIAGDGEKGTGFAPYLRFDEQGRPHIVFLDHGSEHFSEAGQLEYAGHIRHAWRKNATEWEIESIYRQNDPKKQQIVFPAFAMNGSELAVIALERATDWNLSIYPPVLTSTYRFGFITAALK